jgi:hypothetical protein
MLTELFKINMILRKCHFVILLLLVVVVGVDDFKILFYLKCYKSAIAVVNHALCYLYHHTRISTTTIFSIHYYQKKIEFLATKSAKLLSDQILQEFFFSGGEGEGWMNKAKRLSVFVQKTSA